MFISEDTLAQMGLFLWVIAFWQAQRADPLNTRTLSSITYHSQDPSLLFPFSNFPYT